MFVSSFKLQFEEETRGFLKDLGFQDIDGGRRFRIGSVQIDAVGGHEETLLVIECSTRKSLGKVVTDHRENMRILERGFKSNETYKKYKKFRFIVATNRQKIRYEDSKLAGEEPKIYIWDGIFKRYYDKLHSLIGEYAKYNILAEIEVQPTKKSTIESIALRTRIRGYTVFQLFADPRKLIEFSYVARRGRGSEEYYQRFIKNEHLKKVVRFLDDKKGMFPTNIVVSIDRPTFSVREKIGDIEIGKIKFPRKYRSCWLIDGQHRLYGFCHAKSTVKVPVLAFEKLELKQHANFFIDINREQQKVPPDLLWDLEGILRPDEDEGIISRICKQLNAQKGPLNERIYIPIESFVGEKKKKLKLSGLCQSIEKAKLVREHSSSMTPGKGKRTSPLHNKDANKRVKKVSGALNSYFKFVDENFGQREKDEFVFTNGGISVMVYLFERILARLRKVPGNVEFIKYLSPVKDYLADTGDLKAIIDLCNSEAGRDRVVGDFLVAITKRTGDKKISVGLDLKSVEEMVQEFEPVTREFVKKMLVKKFPTDWGAKIPKDIIEEISDKHGKAPPDQEFFDFLDLAECEKIMRSKGSGFKKTLLESHFGFTREDELWILYEKIVAVRNPVAHKRKIELKPEDETLLQAILSKFKKVYEQGLASI
jgi:DNA sulfur modification protein DndB